MGDAVKYYGRNVKAKITMKDRWEVVAIIQEVGDEWWDLGWAGRTDRVI